MTKYRLPDGTLKSFQEITQIPVSHISAYLSGNRIMSQKRSFVLEKASQELGYNFTATDWMFNPQKIKAALSNNNRQPRRPEKKGEVA